MFVLSVIQTLGAINLHITNMKHFLTTLLIFSSAFAFGQTKKVQFFGLNLMQYQQPVKVGDGYQAYYKNMGDTREQGRIILNETSKTFTIKFLDGDEWVGKYSKVTTEKTYDQMLGNVVRVTYKGKWTDDNGDCELIVTTTEKSQCVFNLRSTKIIDEDYGINTWKRVFRFFNINECLQSL
jgi:hypothetical protein